MDNESSEESFFINENSLGFGEDDIFYELALSEALSLTQFAGSSKQNKSDNVSSKTLDTLIKEYVRTMHIPLVTSLRKLSDSEEERKTDDDDHKYIDEIDVQKQNGDNARIEDGSGPDAWKQCKDETQLKEEMFHTCLLNVDLYGNLVHEPYKEIKLRVKEQCDECEPFGELGRCICCGGASFISSTCKLHRDHLKQRLLKEARVYHLIENGKDYSELDLLAHELANPDMDPITAQSLCDNVPKGARAILLPAVTVGNYLTRLRDIDFDVYHFATHQRNTNLGFNLLWNKLTQRY